MKKLLRNTLLVVLTLLAFKTANLTVYAANEHVFSFKAYTCSDGVDTDEAECLSTPVALSNNSTVQKGQIIQLDLWYKPNINPCTMMQVGVTFNGSIVELVKNAGQTVILEPTPEGQDGIYPNRPGSTKRTNWELDSNDDANNLWMVIEDSKLDQPLETEGVLTRVFFTVKQTATAGDVFNFAYDNDYTLLNSSAPFTSQGISLKVFKVLDTDTTLSSIEVKNGSTNYLTNFNSGTKTYNVYVPNSVSTVTVTGYPTKTSTNAVNSPTATNNSYSLNVSTTKTVTITTTAESGDTDTYTVNVYRLDNNANLTALSLGSGVSLSPDFASGTTSYNASVPYATSSVNVSATKASSKASVSGTGNKSLTAGGVTNLSVTVTPECAGSAYSSVPGNTGTACQPKTYTIAVTRAAASTNNYLSSLAVAGYNIGFNKTNNGPYNLEVNGSVASVNISATVEDTGKATIKSGSKTGSQTLTDGNNQFTVTVVPESTTPERTYTINVYRKSNSVALSGLTVTSNPQGTLNPTSFNANTKTYTYTVGPDVTSVTITPTSSKNATITANGTSNGQGGFTYNPQTQTTATIHVVSEDETANTDYTVNLVRTKSTDTRLSELSVAGYTISPSYSDSTNSYNVTVPSNVSSVNVTATPVDSRTTAAVTGNTGLETGNNTVTVTVTPENGSTSARTITITVKKLNNNANLSSLALTNVDFGTFSSGTISYTATVPYSTNKTKVTAALADTKGSKVVKLNGTTISENTDVTLNVGTNTFTVETKAEDTNVTKTYTVTVTRTAASTDNTLSEIRVDNTPITGFDPTITEYDLAAVASTKSSVNITATKSNEFATIVSGTGSQNLTKNQNNALKVVVKSEAGVEKTYTINIRRKNDNAFLSSLTVTSADGTLSPATFNKNTTAYTYTVGPDVTEVAVTGVCEDTANATVSGNATINPNDVTSKTIRCTAEDTTIYKDYVVSIVRNKSTDTTLDELSVAGYTISPSYSDNTNSYNVTVPSNVNSVSVTATPHDSRTTAVVTGTTTNLQTGNNTVTVTVTPEAGILSKRTITITVKKLDGDATLSGLALTNVNFGTFSSGTTNYSASVPYTTDKTKITASVHGTNATKSFTLNDTPISENTNVDLNVGANTFKVNVTAEDTNVTNTYTVVVNRAAASSDAYLTDLTIDGTTVQGFDGENVYSYSVTVPSNVSSINIGAVPNGTSVIANTSDIGEQTLTTGVNDFEIVVIAQNGQTRVPYELHVTKQNNDNNLNSLSITSNPQGTLTPSTFSSGTTSYTYTVGPDVTEVAISGTLPTGATATGFGTYNPNNTTAVNVVVSAEDPNVTPKTYTINLVRNKSTDTTLDELSVAGYTLSPNYSDNTDSYDVTVPSTESSISVTATPHDSRTTAIVSGKTTGLETGNNTVTVTVTPESGANNARVITINVKKQSSDATLSDLTFDNVTLEPDFDPSITSYTATVPYTTDETEVHATKADENASDPIITGDTTLDVGENTFTITVTPEDPNVDPVTYTVTITREDVSTEAYLTSLTVDGTSVPEFDKDTDSYSIEVSNSTSQVIIAATANTYSTVSGDTGTQGLTVGNNTFTINAVAQDGTTTVPYTLNIKRLDNTNTLSDLTITSDPQGTLDTPFDPNTTEYTYTVGPDTPTITVAGTPAGNATVAGDGEFDPTTTDKIEVVVTPEEGEPKTYTINVVRNKSTDVTLDELSVVEGTITPSYADDVDSYSVTVSSDVDQVNVTATPHDPRTNASVSGNTNLQTGDNPVTVTVTPESGDADKRVITINVHKKNTDATLSSLSLDNVTLEPTFDPSITTYTATVPYTTTETVVNATPSDTSRTPVIVGDTNLGVGENTFTITVTPEEGDPVTYEVKVTREDPSSEVYLTGITVNGTAIEGFDKDTDTYTVDIANSITEAEIIGTANTNSTVEGNGTQTNLVIGDNGPYTITAKAQDGTTTKPYYVTIHRKDNNNKLSGLVITADPAGTLDIPFDPDTTEYTYTVGPDTPAITVTGTPAGGATVTGDGTFDPTTTDKIEVVVTPEDGTPQTYTINVVRNKSTNADLLSLGIDGYTIAPSFDKDTILYSVTVPNSVDKVTVVAEKGDSRQSIDGLGQKDVVVGDNPLQVVVTPEDTTAQPKTYTIKVTREANDNNYLQSLSVTGFNLKESFNKELQAYTLDVPIGTNSITVNASPEVNTSNVTITGADNLASDTNTVTVRVVSQKGTPRDYIITVTKTDDAEFITSEVYGHTIADGMIKTVTYKTKPNELKDQLDNENAKLHIYTTNASIEEVDNNLSLGTGYIVKLINNGVLKDSKLIVVKGDVDGDGVATLFDTVKILNHYLEKETLTGVYFEAADVDSDGEITLFDAVEALKIYLNDSE